MPKILIVDDDQGLRTLFGQRLKRAGMDVVYAKDGREGLRAAEEERPDLIILENQMPVMSGNEMLYRLQQTSWGQDIKVIMTTISLSLHNIPGVEEADLTLCKPISTLELITMVKRLLIVKAGAAVQA